MTTDLAIINIPLSRRGDINAELDRFKAAQRKAEARQARADRAERQSDKTQAKALLGQYEAAILATHGAKFGEKTLRHMLDRWVKWEPKRLIAFVERFRLEARGKATESAQP